MRLFLQYLKEQWRVYITGGIFCLIFTISFLLYHLPLKAVLYPTILCMITGIFILISDFRRVRKKHERLHYISSIADVAEGIFPDAEKMEVKDYQEIIYRIAGEYNEHQAEARKCYQNMIDYYTVWVHQIKTPISSMRLHLQNEDSPLSRKIMTELQRVEQYVEMVLTFLRLNTESTDYVIKEYDLDKIIKQAVRKFSSDFIGRKLSLIYEPVNAAVITDEKWLSFVIEQVLSNALKYTMSGSITITLENKKTLRIRDTGIGIAPEDLPRIFENGYSGYNGRFDKKASGLGLYLCKRICNNLGHTITARSIVDVGTIIDIGLLQTELEIE